MPDTVADASRRFSLFSGTESLGSRVRITRGPLEGLLGLVAALYENEVLVDLRDTATGLFVRCQKAHLALCETPLN